MAQGNVIIPPAVFLKRVRHEYGDTSRALVREFTQNSVDAGATRIDFITGVGCLTVRDNGCGIRPERMVEALLTLGGSVKSGDEAIGGYGIAKELLLFAHRSYRIRTLRTLVEGEVLSYSMSECAESFAGAEFSIQFADGFGFRADTFQEKARSYLGSCRLDAEVYLDGEKVVTDLRARKIDMAFAHGRILSRRLPDEATTDELLVRVRGLTMFSQSVRSSNKQIIVELEGDVRAMMTSNRDGLRYPFSNALGEVVANVTVDPKSFDRQAEKTEIFPGRDASFYRRVAEVLTNTVGGGTYDTHVHAVYCQIRSAIDAGTPLGPILQQALSLARDRGLTPLPESVDEFQVIAANFSTDFLVSIEGTDLRHPPRNMKPATMALKYRRIAQAWRYCIEETIKAAGLTLNYRIGFVLDPAKGGYFKMNSDTKVADILVNPLKVAEIENANERFMSVLITAVHELAHQKHGWHDEGFVQESERLLQLVLSRFSKVGRHARAARVLSL